MYTRKFAVYASLVVSLASCSVQQRISKGARNNLLKLENLSHAHVGISIFDPVANKYIYDYQGGKYFIPASNTKIFTCYAGLKYLPDSVPGINYREDDTAVYLFPTGDPTLLHKDFRHHPVIDYLKRHPKTLYITGQAWKTDALGSGWAWNDYNEAYMAERSPLPLYGNVIRWIQERTAEENKDSMAFDQSLSIYSIPEVNWKVRFGTELSRRSFFVQRSKAENVYQITEGTEKKKEQEIPFVTDGLQAGVELLKDTIHKEVTIAQLAPAMLHSSTVPRVKTIYSHHIDSVLKPMMHRSDNFYAEQILLMAAHKRSGVINEDSIIDHVLKNDLSMLPQTPRWVDGSGLSRYNLFTPQSFVAILNKMRLEFPIDRLKNIFPTPGAGTLVSYSKVDSNYIFAKTGTLSGVVALSGFVYTRKNRLLIFSVLVNNHRATATEVRRGIQSFLSFLRNSY